MKTWNEMKKWAQKNKYSTEYAKYYYEHQYCEADFSIGMLTPASPPHHILSRGAHGNIDEGWNLVSLSFTNHRLVEQNPDKFFKLYPEMKQKWLNAKESFYGIIK